METTSNVLFRTVQKKQSLNLEIEGKGIVRQSAGDGQYFIGDDIDLTAVTNGENKFLGWYIDDVCVSTDVHYIAEMSDGLTIKAVFESEAKLKKIKIQKLPDKLSYLENEMLDLSGLEILVSYSDGSSEVTNTCTATISSNKIGTQKVTVTIGKYSDSFNVEIAHNMSDWREIEEATCTQGGSRVKICLVCGYMKSETTETIPHKEETRNSVDPTCTEAGYAGDIYCSICDTLIRKGSTIKKLGHNYGNWIAIDNETHQRICANDSTHIETKSHAWNKGKITKDATCTESGVKLYTCSDCGTTKTEAIPMIAHSPVIVKGKAATCTETGLTDGTKCSVCGTVITKQDTIPATGHKYSDWTVAKAATCTTDGTEQRV